MTREELIKVALSSSVDPQRAAEFVQALAKAAANGQVTVELIVEEPGGDLMTSLKVPCFVKLRVDATCCICLLPMGPC